MILDAWEYMYMKLKFGHVQILLDLVISQCKTAILDSHRVGR
jgi:hypothetical protein